jgi:hypothetical protein
LAFGPGEAGGYFQVEEVLLTENKALEEYKNKALDDSKNVALDVSESRDDEETSSEDAPLTSGWWIAPFALLGLIFWLSVIVMVF